MGIGPNGTVMIEQARDWAQRRWAPKHPYGEAFTSRSHAATHWTSRLRIGIDFFASSLSQATFDRRNGQRADAASIVIHDCRAGRRVNLLAAATPAFCEY